MPRTFLRSCEKGVKSDSLHGTLTTLMGMKCPLITFLKEIIEEKSLYTLACQRTKIFLVCNDRKEETLKRDTSKPNTLDMETGLRHMGSNLKEM